MDQPADPYQYAACCGLYCGACDWMIATQAYERQKAAGVDAKPPEYTCHGCKSDLLAPFCASCSMRACAGQRSIQFCFECSDYPCAKLIAFRDDGRPHHEWAIRNLDVIRRVGPETWVAQQHSRWRCSGCGTPFGFYARKCKQCGQPLRNCKDDLT